ncbi:hypothetical protein [Nostoc sp. NMS4]|uniref:hypothetical protein n=1 Tax=Nostoc sp. NMS4 TaxID=2815390 RepID=UPI0025CD3427|nr:hypothetical protein [Nostoc sp. NMS4]MBN3926765.1 hypothetical protein [Nostoc sp. NMS4]
MLKLSDARNFFILTSLFFVCCYDANSSSIASSIENQPQIAVNSGCNIKFDPTTRQFTLISKITVNAQLSRARCIIRINTSNIQKQFRLVPLAFKGEVKKAPAQVAISSFLLGTQPTSLVYPSSSNGISLKFDLTKQILPTNYTSQGNSVLGINLVLRSTGGELELTDVKFALQQK